MRINPIKRIISDSWPLIILMAFFYFISKVTAVSFFNFSYTNGQGQVVSIGDDFSRLRFISPGKYSISGQYRFTPISPAIITVVPDDCLEKVTINGLNLKLQSDGKTNLCRNDFGIDINLIKDSHLGVNTIKFTLSDGGGGGALHVKRAMRDASSWIYTLSIIMILGYVFYLIYRYLHFPKLILIIFFFGIIIRLIYLSYTNYDARVHDLGGHLDYIQYIVDHHSLPIKDACWECHQKPLYYFIGSGIFSFTKAFGFNGSQFLQILQGFSLVLFLASAVLFFQIFKTLWPTGRLAPTALMMYLFWPANIIHSLRIGNDSLMYFFYAIAFYCICRASARSVNFKILLVALIFAGLAFFTKVTAFPLFLIIVILMVGAIRSQNIMNIGKVVMVILTIALFVYLAFQKYFQSSNNRDFFSHIVNSAVLNKELAVNSKPVNYLLLDIKSFLNYPYNSPWDDQKGRQYFWNFFLKSMLFGEFEFKTATNMVLASTLNLLLLPVLLCASLSVFLIKRPDRRKYAIFGLNFLLLVGMLIAFRIVYPFACNQDYRYILPVIISVAYGYVYTQQRLHELQLKQLENISVLLINLFLILSNIFFIIYPLNI